MDFGSGTDILKPSANIHWLATVMQASPSTHFVSFAQSILYRGPGIAVVWLEFVIVAAVGDCSAFAVFLRKTTAYGI